MTRDPRRARRNLTGVRVPKYRLHRPSGQAVVTLAQRDHYLGAHGSEASKAEALTIGRPVAK